MSMEPFNMREMDRYIINTPFVNIIFTDFPSTSSLLYLAREDAFRFEYRFRLRHAVQEILA